MVYWLNFSPWRVPFSVRRAVLTISNAFMMTKRLSLQAGSQLVQRSAGNHEFVGPKNLVGVQSIGRRDDQIRDVARSQGQVLFNHRINHQRRTVNPEALQRPDKRLGLVGIEIEIGNDLNVTGLE